MPRPKKVKPSAEPEIPTSSTIPIPFDEFDVTILMPPTENNDETKGNSLVEVQNSALYHQFRQQISVGGFGASKDSEWPVAELKNDSNTLQGIAFIKPEEIDKKLPLSDAQLTALQERVSQYMLAMDDLTADVLDIITIRWLQEARHTEGLITLHADDVLRMRGRKAHKGGSGRRGGYLEKDRKDVSKHMEILAETWIKVFEMEISQEQSKQKRKKISRATWQGESRAIVVTSRAGIVNTDGELDPYLWRVRPGDIFAPFLFGPGRQTAMMSLKALEYNPYRQKFEKRLTRYLTWQWRNRQKDASYLNPISVLKVLKSISERKKASDNPGDYINKKNPLQTRERLEKALDKLQDDGVIAAWQYESIDESIVGNKGWGLEWLKWKLIIEPPSEILDKYDRIGQPSQRQISGTVIQQKPAPVMVSEPANDLGLQLKALRKKLKKTQIQAAEEIGIGQATLSRVEKGKMPDNENLAKIRNWFISHLI